MKASKKKKMSRGVQSRLSGKGLAADTPNPPPRVLAEPLIIFEGSNSKAARKSKSVVDAVVSGKNPSRGPRGQDGEGERGGMNEGALALDAGPLRRQWLWTKAGDAFQEMHGSKVSAQGRTLRAGHTFSRKYEL